MSCSAIPIQHVAILNKIHIHEMKKPILPILPNLYTHTTHIVSILMILKLLWSRLDYFLT